MDKVAAFGGLIKKYFIVLIIGFGFAGHAFSATNYFVATNGNDSGAGTEAEPFRTIKKGADIAQPGDMVIVKPGRYNEFVAVPRSGAPDKPITFKSSEKWQAVISAAVPLSGFKLAPESRNVWMMEFVPPTECFGLIEDSTLRLYTMLPGADTCELVPGSYYLDRKSQRIFVHAWNSEDPNRLNLELVVQPGVFYAGQWTDNKPKHNIIIDGFTVKHSWRESGGGVVYAHGSTGGILRNCRVENCFLGVLIGNDADDTLVENCEVVNCSDGIKCAYLHRAVLRNNRIVRRDDNWPAFAMKSSMGINLYCWFKDGRNSISVENNYISGFVTGIRPKIPAVLVCRNNTVVDCEHGIGPHCGEYREFVNNLILNCRIPMELLDKNNGKPGLPPRLLTDYNCVYSYKNPALMEKWLADWRKLTGQEQHGLIASPRLLGAYPVAIYLATNSPCIGKGEKGGNIGSFPVIDVVTTDTNPPNGEIMVIGKTGNWKPPSPSQEQKEEVILAEPWQMAREAMTSHVLIRENEAQLEIKAWDAVGAVKVMQFSNDGRKWSEAVPVAAKYAWKVSPGDGEKTVYARFQDEAGNWSQPVTTKAWKKTQPPKLKGSLIKRANRSGASLAWECTEPCDGQIRYGWGDKFDRSRRAFLYVDEEGGETNWRHVVFLKVPDVANDEMIRFQVVLSDCAGNGWTSEWDSVSLKGPAQTFFVAKNGDDANSGASDKPWQTLARTTRSVLPGDTVKIRKGIYREALVVPCGGVTNDSRIKYQAEGPVTIEGAGKWPYGAVLQGVQFVNIEGFEFRGFKTMGIVMKGCSDIGIRNNSIHSGYGERPAGTGPFTGEYGVYAEDSRRIEVSYNQIYWNCRNLVFYLGGGGNRIDHNTIVDNVYANLGLWFRWGDGPGIYAEVANNIIAGEGNWMLEYSSYPEKGLVSQHNCVMSHSPSKGDVFVEKPQPTKYKALAEWQKKSGLESNSISFDPLFEDAGKGNFQLKENSPCSEAGEDGTNIGAW